MTTPTTVSTGALFTPSEAGGMIRRARMSGNGCYRYWLERTWNADLPYVCWIGLNPSTADAREDDPTIRRMIGFAKSWGYGSIEVVNLFAFRATDPADMKAAGDPIGPGCNAELLHSAKRAALVVACWGAHGGHRSRDCSVRQMLRDEGIAVKCLGITKDGSPRHPLYLPKSASLEVMP